MVEFAVSNQEPRAVSDHISQVAQASIIDLIWKVSVSDLWTYRLQEVLELLCVLSNDLLDSLHVLVREDFSRD